MKIGIDFDNTLAIYDTVFLDAAHLRDLVPRDWIGTKTQLRDKLRLLPNGEQEWQKLQGLVYGELQQSARLMEGAAWFLYQCRSLGVDVFVVSHKTKYARYDHKKISLRQTALKWMEDKGFFDKKQFALTRDKVYFESTREKKIERISSLGCTYFIDDLVEVLSCQHFPKKVTKILYRIGESDQLHPCDLKVCSTWKEISRAIFGPSFELDLTIVAQNLVFPAEVISCQMGGQGGNSSVYKVELSSGEFVALKRYPRGAGSAARAQYRITEGVPGDRRNRLDNEFTGCAFLNSRGIDEIPKPYERNDLLNVATYEWINGKRISAPTNKDLTAVLKFVESLRNLSRSTDYTTLSKAGEACLNPKEAMSQVVERFKRLSDVNDITDQLSAHLTTEFEPVWHQTVRWAKQKWPSNLEFNDDLPPNCQVLNPADLGFHNILRESSGQLRFIDLEYFGWDDPVKLVSDFLWHPGMSLPKTQVVMWLDGTIALFQADSSFLSRLKAMFPVYGMRWSLIVLNLFLSRSSEPETPDNILLGQLIKSRKLINSVQKWMKDQNEWHTRTQVANFSKTRH